MFEFMDHCIALFLNFFVMPLMLPLCAIGGLCMLCGARPEPVISGLLGLFLEVFTQSCKLAGIVIKTTYEFLRARILKEVPPPLPKRWSFFKGFKKNRDDNEDKDEKDEE